MTRAFTDSVAVRRNVPIHIGLVGSSGSGKTKSSLRLATGMQRITGGDIYAIDTEADRALHYAEDYKFRHVPFGAPFDALSYLAAVEHCVKKGAKTVIIDSASHLHEGPGGTLEMHEAECERLVKAWNTTRDKVQMSAWQRPKQELRRFINTVLQMPVSIIWCFRAKEKLKIIPGKQPQQLGFMPVAGDEMIYEMTLNCLLYPASGGVPSWHPEEMGERAIIKLPQQFVTLFEKPRPLDEDTGEQLAKWAAGSAAPQTLKVDPTKGAAAGGTGTGGVTPAPLTEQQITTYIDTMSGAETAAQLDTIYASAFDTAKRARDNAARERLKAAHETFKKSFTSTTT